MFKLTEGQMIKLNVEFEIWNDDDTLAARIEAGTPLEVLAICLEPAYSGDYYNVDVKVVSSTYNGWTHNLDIFEDDIES